MARSFYLPSQEAATKVEVLINECISRFGGVPLELDFDQGRNFQSAVLLRIRKTKTPPTHP